MTSSPNPPASLQAAKDSPYFTGIASEGACGLFCIETSAFPVGIVIFGASGDLSFRKIIPALYNLRRRSLLPANFFVLGVGRSQMEDQEFRQRAREALGTEEITGDFLKSLHYLSLDYHIGHDYDRLANRVSELSEAFGTRGNLLHYLAVPPSLFSPIIGNLSSRGLVRSPGSSKSLQSSHDAETPFARVIVEKPFGRDMASAQALNRELEQFMPESDILRIDHYLGKETVQNILMLRFANSIFEPLWNRHYIDHVQITVAEELGVEHRAGFYEQNGLVRDMFQNHLLQIMSLIAMEPPASFQADSIRDEKVKVLSCTSLARDHSGAFRAVTGQYGRSSDDRLPAYREEPGVAPDSFTETFAAAVLQVDNWRWKGVPFLLRSGKRLARKATQVNIVFKAVPHFIFCPTTTLEHPGNRLIMDIQPQERIRLVMNGKIPGPKLCMSSMAMSFDYNQLALGKAADAYERLILDAILGDLTLFVRQRDLMEAWRILEPLLSEMPGKMPEFYGAGTWGPESAMKLASDLGRTWLEP